MDATAGATRARTRAIRNIGFMRVIIRSDLSICPAAEALTNFRRLKISRCDCFRSRRGRLPQRHRRWRSGLHWRGRANTLRQTQLSKIGRARRDYTGRHIVALARRVIPLGRGSDITNAAIGPSTCLRGAMPPRSPSRSESHLAGAPKPGHRVLLRALSGDVGAGDARAYSRVAVC